MPGAEAAAIRYAIGDHLFATHGSRRPK
jgi:hypothetical protein